QKAEGRRQKAEGRRQKAEKFFHLVEQDTPEPRVQLFFTLESGFLGLQLLPSASAFCLLTSAFCLLPGR
ncbi:MAG: hypothetical protein ABI837_14510, partial [Acidobacteriota bacterium]